MHPLDSFGIVHISKEIKISNKFITKNIFTIMCAYLCFELNDSISKGKSQ